MGKVLRQPEAPDAARAPYSEPLLNERETTHGDFGQQTETVQAIKEVMHGAPNWQSRKTSAAMRESLELIATKVGRILHGDPNHKDSWDDIAGYAKLVAERLKS